MLVACWSAKGGSGTTTVAAALAIEVARRHAAGALLVDLAGDLPLVLGLPELDSPGIADWLAAGAAVPPDGLARLEVPVGEAGCLALIPTGGPLPDAPGRWEVLAAVLAADPRPVVVDCGSRPAGLALVMAASAPVSFLVLRPCYLALRRALSSPIRPSSVIVVDEPGRSLGPRAIAEVLGVPVKAVVPNDPRVARSVDAGRLGSSVPATLARAVRRAA